MTLQELIEKGKEGKLSITETVELAYAAENWHEMALRCERTIHRIIKDGEAHTQSSLPYKPIMDLRCPPFLAI